MSAQETENQTGGAEASPEITAPEIEGNDAAADVAAESVSTEISDTLAGDAGPVALSSGEPQADAEPTAAEKLHAAAVAYIIAARVAGVNHAEYLEAKIVEIAD